MAKSKKKHTHIQEYTTTRDDKQDYTNFQPNDIVSSAKCSFFLSFSLNRVCFIANEPSEQHNTEKKEENLRKKSTHHFIHLLTSIGREERKKNVRKQK